MAKKKSLEQVIKENIQFGFDPSVIKIAYENVAGDSQKIMDEIFRLQNQSQNYTTKPSNPQDEDAQLSKAIEQSINAAKGKNISLEPLNPQQRLRKSGFPVGLKNIGNTCYFNSLIQTYFQNGAFVKQVLHYQIPAKYKEKADAQQNKINQQDSQMKRKQASCKLVENLKLLFATMIASDRKYADPTAVMTSIVDQYGNDYAIGDQKDIGEFNLVFLERINEGMSLAKKQRQMDVQQPLKNKSSDDSPSKVQAFGAQQQMSETFLMKRSSIKIDEKSVIAHQFFGKIQNFYNNPKQNIHISQQQLFSLLQLNVKHKEMYKACQQIVISHVDDYRNQKGQIVGVQKQSWIKEAPKTLFFQINRVGFNKQKGILQKNNSIFDFPKVFYVDPFTEKNKEKALQIQQKVKSLRAQKQNYQNALKQIQNYGEKGINLIDLLSQTSKFLSNQLCSMDAENQTDQPTIFSDLSKQLKEEHIKLIKKYKESVEQRAAKYHKQIELIDRQIQKHYDLIRSTPYHLYSILIHEGSADSGHYYSYTYDFENNVWRKYNDINISQEAQQQVIKQAKGVNYTSAYYLVYAQKQVLVPADLKCPLRTYKLSNQQTYMNDYFSGFLSEQLRKYVNNDNQKLYYDIENYKMSGYVNRVAQCYQKRFQMCNGIARTLKQDANKKNQPPVLANLPVYVKFKLNDDQYKNLLMENAIHEFGPKQQSAFFIDQLQKKKNSFGDFKKPKKLHCTKPQIQNVFMQNVYRSIITKNIYKSIYDANYKGIFGMLKELSKAEVGDYFSWMSNLLFKVLAVRFLIEAEESAKEHSQVSIQMLRHLIVLLFKFIKRDQEKPLINNCVLWVAQLAVDLPADHKLEAEKITEMLTSNQYKDEYGDLQHNKFNETVCDQIKSGVQISDAMWNLSRKEDTFIQEMIDARNNTEEKMKTANKIYQAMKKSNLPLKKEERDAFKLQAKNQQKAKLAK